MKSAIEVIQIMRDSLVIDAHLLMVNREERKALVEEFDRLCAELAKASKDQIAEMEGARAKAMEGAAPELERMMEFVEKVREAQAIGFPVCKAGIAIIMALIDLDMVDDASKDGAP
jgi:hypothetical protein